MADTLLVTPYYDPNIVGGAEISTQLIAEGLLGRCDVLTFGAECGLRMLNNVKVYELYFPEYTNLWAQPLNGTSLSIKNKFDGHFGTLFPTKHNLEVYRAFFREHRYKTVVMNSNETVMDRPSLWKAAHESGARVVLTLRDNMLLEKKVGNIDYSGLFRSVVRSQLKWIDRFVAPSQYMIDLYAQYGMKKKNSSVIPNAVKRLSVDSVPFSGKQGVIYAGSISEQKGIPLLIQAAKHFVDGHQLTLIGRGPLVRLARDVPGVNVLDWMAKDELHRVMARAKVLVLPSIWPEAFGRVLVEAVRCGTLVVGSSVGGIPEVLAHDGRLLFPVGDAEALASRVNFILGLSEEEYDAMLGQVRNAMARFNVETYVSAWSRVLNDA